MTRHHDHIRAGGLDLVKLAPGVENSFLIISVYQCAAPASAADLVHLVGVQVDPVFHALAEDPAWFIKVAVPETFLRLPAVIARIVICGRSRKF